MKNLWADFCRLVALRSLNNSFRSSERTRCVCTSAAEARHANNFQPRWLYNFAHHRWYRQPPDPSRTPHRTVLPRHNVLNEKSSLHYLLTNKRDVNIVNRLRHAKTFELSQTRTERFKKNRSFHTVLHISNSIYGRYTLFSWLLVLAWTLYF